KQKVDIAVAKEQLDAQKQTGDAINQMLEAAVDVSRQISQGRLDVKA
ncbi:MAG: putative motility protein, partial [Planctomycetota bacterium]